MNAKTNSTQQIKRASNFQKLVWKISKNIIRFCKIFRWKRFFAVIVIPIIIVIIIIKSISGNSNTSEVLENDISYDSSYEIPSCSALEKSEMDSEQENEKATKETAQYLTEITNEASNESIQNSETNAPNYNVSASTPEYCWGIDISYNQQDFINPQWLENAKEKGLGFVYIQCGRRSKSGQIESKADSAISYATMCEKLEIPFGFYFLTEATSWDEAYAEYGFIEDFLITSEYQQNKFPFMLDVEHRNGESQEIIKLKATLIDWLLEKIATIPEKPTETILYIGTYRYLDFKPYLTKVTTLWVADHSCEPSYPKEGFFSDNIEKHFFDKQALDKIVIWQYTSDNKLNQERGIATYSNNEKRNLELDRNLMLQEFYKKYVGKKTKE